MNNFEEIGARFRIYLEYKGIGINEAARKTGVSGSQISNIVNGKNFGTDKLFNILNVFTDLSSEWLFFEQGEMIKSEDVVSEPNKVYKLKTDTLVNSQEIPLYNVEASAGIVGLFNSHNDKVQPVDYISIPNLPKCDGALYVSGDSMYPLLKSGDIVMYKEINDIINNIFWGEMYLISIDVDGEEYVSIKWIQKSDKGEDFIRLVSENRHHQPKDIPLGKVRAMAFIKASIRINSMI
ncbi:transcriptional regulator [Neptunitalea chrysea]|uniref:Transcriptional regulator n=1 Tax=Neptunitalea chrysea TaxID=1647581 RepID=A0A9W6B3K6_9FLAO|nr:XRE family transcriptional regulator [Neptunitalea chrysea]GLB51745.1 transcriptional regulator [Neptunitalea chrysea]